MCIIIIIIIIIIIRLYAARQAIRYGRSWFAFNGSDIGNNLNRTERFYY